LSPASIWTSKVPKPTLTQLKQELTAISSGCKVPHAASQAQMPQASSATIKDFSEENVLNLCQPEQTHRGLWNARTSPCRRKVRKSYSAAKKSSYESAVVPITPSALGRKSQLLSSKASPGRLGSSQVCLLGSRETPSPSAQEGG